MRKTTSTNYANEREIHGGCPFSRTLGAIGGRWRAVILWKMAGGADRFGALRREIPAITDKMLAQELRRLEASGLVRRRTVSESPPRVDYALTTAGESLLPVLRLMYDWGDRRPAAPEDAAGTPPAREDAR